MVDHCKESADQRSARIEARLADVLHRFRCVHGIALDHGCGHCPSTGRIPSDARLAEADAAVKRGDYWKAEHLAGNAKIDALAARLAEAERDAARYRWLRDSPVEEVDCALLDRIPTEWDAAIDAARADAGEGGK